MSRSPVRIRSVAPKILRICVENRNVRRIFCLYFWCYQKCYHGSKKRPEWQPEDKLPQCGKSGGVLLCAWEPLSGVAEWYDCPAIVCAGAGENIRTVIDFCAWNWYYIKAVSLKLHKYTFAGMVELADAQDLGSCAARRVGSSPTTRTKGVVSPRDALFFYTFTI